MKLLLARIPLGRMLLHTGCVLRGGKARFHLAGIRREFREFCRWPGRFPLD